MSEDNQDLCAIADRPESRCGNNNIIIGMDIDAPHSNCVVIGIGLKTTRDNQIIIGNEEVTVSGEMDSKHFIEILKMINVPIPEGHTSE